MTLPSPFRVASRFLAAREWGDSSKMVSEYREALTAFQSSITALQQRSVQVASGVPQESLPRVFVPLVPLVHAARPLVEWVVQTREIPSGKAKAVEMVARLMAGMSSLPRDPVDWNQKNGARLNLLLEAASWPQRSTGGAGTLQAVSVGPFKVHNTIGANEKQFGEVRGLVESASRALSTTRDFKKVLYGDVFIVGQLKDPGTAAWYSLKDDDVFVRSLAKKGGDDLGSLIHELGHRYWWRFTTPDQRRAIQSLFVELTANKGLFPSRYSMTDYMEFFSECFSFYTLGRMKPDLLKKFEAALG